MRLQCKTNKISTNIDRKLPAFAVVSSVFERFRLGFRRRSFPPSRRNDRNPTYGARSRRNHIGSSTRAYNFQKTTVPRRSGRRTARCQSTGRRTRRVDYKTITGIRFFSANAAYKTDTILNGTRFEKFRVTILRFHNNVDDAECTGHYRRDV